MTYGAIMQNMESELDAALLSHDLIGNPQRAAEFLASIQEPRPPSPVAASIKRNNRRMFIAALLYTGAFISGALAVAGTIDPTVSGFLALALVIAGTVVIFTTGRPSRVTASDVSISATINPDLAIDAGWLDELPLDVITSLDAQARWDAASFMVKITNEGIPEVGTDYDDPTFEDRFSEARQQRTLAMLRGRRR